MVVGKAVCRICRKELDYINHVHLRTHGLTTKQYAQMFPDGEFYSEETRKKVGRYPPSSLPEETVKDVVDMYKNIEITMKEIGEKHRIHPGRVSVVCRRVLGDEFWRINLLRRKRNGKIYGRLGRHVGGYEIQGSLRHRRLILISEMFLLTRGHYIFSEFPVKYKEKRFFVDVVGFKDNKNVAIECGDTPEKKLLVLAKVFDEVIEIPYAHSVMDGGVTRGIHSLGSMIGGSNDSL